MTPTAHREFRLLLRQIQSRLREAERRFNLGSAYVAYGPRVKALREAAGLVKERMKDG